MAHPLIAAILAAAGGSPFNLTDRNPADGSINPENAQAGIDVKNNGTIDVWSSGGEVNVTDEWFRGPASSGFGDNFDVRCTVNSGDAPNGFSPSAGVWHALTSDRNFRLTTSTVETLTGDWTIEVRTSSGGVVCSADYTVTAIETFI